MKKFLFECVLAALVSVLTVLWMKGVSPLDLLVVVIE